MTNWKEAAVNSIKSAEKQIQDAELKAAQLAMEAANERSRAAALEAQVRELKDSKQGYDVVCDSMKQQIYDMARRQENTELAVEALKAKLSRKNELLERLRESNAGYNKGIGRLHEKLRKATERLERLRADYYSLSVQNTQLRRNCEQMSTEIARLKALAREAAGNGAEEGTA